MYNTRELLNRLSLSRHAPDGAFSAPDSGGVTLADFIPYSVGEIRSYYRDALSWGESQHLYREAQQHKKDNQLLEARIFTAANPQLSQAIRVGIQQQAGTRSYDGLFGQRSNSFVNPGSVASMFTPAGYLTELYREAKGLHFASSAYHLAKRRPDLADLLLSQQNMDEELSTLALSNEILMKHVEKKTGKSGDALLQHFAGERVSAGTPYHQPYETIRNAVLTLDPELEALSDNPAVMQAADPASLLAIVGNFPPELHSILMENITESNAKELYKKNFSVPIENFSQPGTIDKYYNLSAEEAAIYDPWVHYDYNQLPEEGPIYKNDQLVWVMDTDGGRHEKYHITIPDQQSFNYFELIPLGGLDFDLRFNFSSSGDRAENIKIQVMVSDENGRMTTIYHDNNFPFQVDKHYSVKVTLQSHDINNSREIWVDRYPPGMAGSLTDFIDVTINKSMHTLEYDLLNLNKLVRLGRATGLAPLELKTLLRSFNSAETITPAALSSLFYTLYFTRRYGISVEEASVLSGGNIGQQALDGTVSHFDRIFNTPLLGGQSFGASSDDISIDPADTTSSHARDTLLRGLDINGSELHHLAKIANIVSDNAHLTLSIGNISLLWRLTQIARLEELAVNDLALLFSISPLPTANHPAFLPWVYQTAKWLKTTGMAPATL